MRTASAAGVAASAAVVVLVAATAVVASVMAVSSSATAPMTMTSVIDNHNTVTLSVTNSLLSDATRPDRLLAALILTEQEHTISNNNNQNTAAGIGPWFRQASSSAHYHARALAFVDDEQQSCDASFIACLPNQECTTCFATLSLESIDWTSVAAGTSCDDVIAFLTDKGYCRSLQQDATAQQVFCDTFNACVVWDEDDDEEEYDYNDLDDLDDDETRPSRPAGWVDCAALTDCEWEGMHKSWIGDGVCHDNMVGCYNTPICQYDGGDCCADTCTITTESSYVECGHDGYACKDPTSTNCNSDLSEKCTKNRNKKNNGGNAAKPSDTKCTDLETKYRLVMYDSFGDGWDTTTIMITPDDPDEKYVVYEGGLVDGFEGTAYICLSKTPQCYNVVTQGGTWGIESSWDIRPMTEGSPSLAGGGTPGNCDFGVAGDKQCPKTCDGTKPDFDPTDDPDYRSFKDMYTCVEDKCVIQLGSCNEDDICKQCFAVDEPPDFCFGMEKFVAVIDCTVCSCTDKADDEYCTKKAGPGKFVPAPGSKKNKIPDAERGNDVRQCTPKETIAGTTAIMDYSSCTNLDSVSLLISDFDQNNFGQLDSFESCAHAYKDYSDHDGRTALSCMQILKNAMTNPTVNGNQKNAPTEAIAALATNLYDHAGTFCECSKKASNACPLCPSFYNFKTILYESIDACQSLDAIDCASWNEFWKPCKKNLEDEFGSTELVDKNMCDYVKNDCGNAGPFPAFRRLDCEEEVSKEAWGFYKHFAKKCLKGSDGMAPDVTPAPASPTTPPAPVDKPTPKPYIPADDKDDDTLPVTSPTKPPYMPPVFDTPTPVPGPPQEKPTPKPYIPNGGKPYNPSDDTGSDSKASSTTKKSKSHWFRNMILMCLLGGVGYYIYTKRFNDFNFVQYRRRMFNGGASSLVGGGGGNFGYGRVNSTGMGESEMYVSNLNSSTSFEPPTLPPTPHQMA